MYPLKCDFYRNFLLCLRHLWWKKVFSYGIFWQNVWWSLFIENNLLLVFLMKNPSPGSRFQQQHFITSKFVKLIKVNKKQKKEAKKLQNITDEYKVENYQNIKKYCQKQWRHIFKCDAIANKRKKEVFRIKDFRIRLFHLCERRYKLQIELETLRPISRKPTAFSWDSRDPQLHDPRDPQLHADGCYFWIVSLNSLRVSKSWFQILDFCVYV